MNFLSNTWKWLLDENNRGALMLIGTGLAATVAAGWALFRHVRKRRDTLQNTDASNRTTHFNHAGAAQYVERTEGGSLTIDVGPNAEQIRAIIEPLLAVNSDQAERIAQLSRQLGLSEAAVGAFFATLGQEQVPAQRWPHVLAQIAHEAVDQTCGNLSAER